MTVENNYAIAISTLSDWLKNFSPVYQQMKRKTKTTFCTRDFSRALSNVPGIAWVLDRFVVLFASAMVG